MKPEDELTSPDAEIETAPPAPSLGKVTYCVWTGAAAHGLKKGQLIAVAPLVSEELRAAGRARYATADEISEGRDKAARPTEF